MDNVVVTPSNHGAQVEQSRGLFVETLGINYGAARKYAQDLIAFFRAEGHGDEWMMMAHDKKGAAGDAMRTERDALYEALRAAGHTNPSVKWKQIKGYAQEFATAERKASGEITEDEAEAEGSGAKHTRSIQLRLIEDLTTLHKACKRESKTLTEQQRNASTHIASALTALGVDLSGL